MASSADPWGDPWGRGGEVISLDYASKLMQPGGPLQNYRIGRSPRDDSKRLLPCGCDCDVRSSSNEALAFPRVVSDSSVSTVQDSEPADDLAEEPALEESPEAMEDDAAAYEADSEAEQPVAQSAVEDASVSPTALRYNSRVARRYARWSITCTGCAHRKATGEEAANQMAHCDVGGCMSEEAAASYDDPSSAED